MLQTTANLLRQRPIPSHLQQTSQAANLKRGGTRQARRSPPLPPLIIPALLLRRKPRAAISQEQGIYCEQTASPLAATATCSFAARGLMSRLRAAARRPSPNP